MKFRYLLLLALAPAALQAQTGVNVDRILATDAVPVRLPAGHDQPNVLQTTYGWADWLREAGDDLDAHHPRETGQVQWMGRSLRVAARSAGSRPEPGASWIFFHIETDRYDDITLSLSLNAAYQARIGSTTVLSQAKADTATKSHTLALPAGKHTVRILVLRSDGADAGFRARVSGQHGQPTVSVTPDRPLTLELVLDGPTTTGIDLSADGSLAAVTLSRTLPPSDRSESWVEIRRVSDGGLVQTYRGGMSVGGLMWAPEGRKFAYIQRNDGAVTLWMVDLETGHQRAIAEGLRDMGGFRWAADGTSIYASVSENPTSSTTGFTRLQVPDDRIPGTGTVRHLVRIWMDGSRQRLTWGPASVNLHDEHPRDGRLLVSTDTEDLSARPYGTTTFWWVDPATGTRDSLFTDRWAGTARISPDGRRLAVSGSPEAFGGIGDVTGDSLIANSYDTQLFLYELGDRSVKSITSMFYPSTGDFRWTPDGQLWITAADKAQTRIFRYDLRRQRFEPVSTGTDMAGGLSISRNGRMAAFIGNGVNLPPKAYVFDTERMRVRLFLDAAPETFADVRYGDIQPWTFTTADGTEIDGHVYYPRNYDPSRKYPVIVYYYGGTTPVTRDFGGRYPKEVWAANGYFVYVLQPSGAIGYGQGFSARHVNNWGITVADEIIEGTRKFLAAHPAADPARVGAIGASYGGFMTMLLTTRTDLFRAAVSHAGISNITSYWGEGYWGYTYSSGATAGSFPWNRRDIYVDQSPIFHADKVTTPLLLLHGAADTNVPLGESWQFYTALKLLGKRVELVEVADQNHHILAYGKRVRWSQTILAWFDMELKDQPEWWRALYP